MPLPAVLPDTIGQLSALKELILYNNQIEGEHLCSTNRALTTLPAALPESIGQLEALEVLYLNFHAALGKIVPARTVGQPTPGVQPQQPPALCLVKFLAKAVWQRHGTVAVNGMSWEWLGHRQQPN